MQTFKDTQTGQFWQFDDDVVVIRQSGGEYGFYSRYGVIEAPRTLVPANLAEMPPRPADVPRQVSRYQGREAMRMTPHPKKGFPEWTLFDAFEERLGSSDSPAGYLRAWADLQVFEIDGAMLNATADALGLAQAQRDDLFRLAATLKA